MRTILALIVAAFLHAGLSAQVHVDVRFNIGMQPAWGPPGYGYVEYYYIPEIEVYYHVPMRRFYYFDGGHWLYHTSLPPRYHDVDLYHVRKVVINEPHPWNKHRHYREKYVSRRGDSRHNYYRDRDHRDTRNYRGRDRDHRRIEPRSHPNRGNWNKHERAGKPGRGNRGRGHR